jgi:hypothetical protein
VLSKEQLFSKSQKKGAELESHSKDWILVVPEDPATGEPGTESSPPFSARLFLFFDFKNAGFGFKNE